MRQQLPLQTEQCVVRVRCAPLCSTSSPGSVLRTGPVHEEQNLFHSTALWLRPAAGNSGLCLPDDQEDVRVILLQPKHHLSQEGSIGTGHQPDLAGAPGGQPCQTAVFRLRQTLPGCF